MRKRFQTPPNKTV